MFNNREIATAIWLLVFTAWMLSFPSVRESIFRLFRSVLHWKILACVGLMAIYTGASISIFWLAGLWNLALLKDTVLWFFFTGFVVLMHFMTELNNKITLRKALRASITLLVFVEYLINTYVFPLWAEMMLVPFMTILFSLDAFSRRDDKYSDVTKLTSILSSILGLGIFVFVVTRAIDDWRNLGSIDTFRSIAFPPLMTIAFIPFIYCSLLIAAYENLFIRLNIGSRKTSDVKQYAKSRIYRHCRLSLRSLNELSSHAFRFHALETIDDVDNVFLSAHEKGR